MLQPLTVTEAAYAIVDSRYAWFVGGDITGTSNLVFSFDDDNWEDRTATDPIPYETNAPSVIRVTEWAPVAHTFRCKL